MKKKDYIYLLIAIILYLLLVIIITGNTFYYGSSLDWYSQHISIPEYFRTLFYDTKELIPSFAMNIGAGQNIFNFSYYGLLSPIILISYLFPFISMVDYLMLASIILNIISTILLYKFLRKNNFSEETSFISITLFILSSAFTLHSYRHIMFVNYMPFLIMGLFGIDRKIEKNSNILLIISIFLMIMTSYYFSISGIFVLILYYLYKKRDLKSLKSIILPIATSILIASIILIPTLYTLLSNRMISNTSISILDLIIPSPSNISNLSFYNYGIGLSFIAFISLIHLFFKDRASSIVLIIIVMFNFFNYLLNGFIYINPKSLIPFLPIFIYVIAIFIQDIFDKKVNVNKLVKTTIPFIIYFIFGSGFGLLITLESLFIFTTIYLYNRKNNKRILFIYFIPFVFLISYFFNNMDLLESKTLLVNDENSISKLLEEINIDDFYRVNINYKKSTYTNKIFNNIDYFNVTSYSSINNIDYNKFYYDRLTNEMPYRNRSLVVSSNNLLSNMLLSNKYIISREKAPLLYDEIKFQDYYLYKNDNVLPVSFHNSNLITYKDFEKLNKYEQQVGFLKLIVNEKVSRNEYKEVVKKENITLKDLFNIDGDTIEIDAKHGEIFKYKLEDSFKNKILFINFNLKEQNRDLAIKINGMTNKLTNKNWKYYNGNNDFTYTLSISDEEELIIVFDKGKYIIKDLEVYSLDVEEIKDVIKSVTPLNVTSRRGNTINGNINVSEDGYLLFTIPYDKGFKAYVDGKKAEIEKIDYSFIGFPLSKGRHIVSLEYEAPYLKIAKYISFFGILVFVSTLYFGKKINYRKTVYNNKTI